MFLVSFNNYTINALVCSIAYVNKVANILFILEGWRSTIVEKHSAKFSLKPVLVMSSSEIPSSKLTPST